MITAKGVQFLASRVARQRLTEIPRSTWEEWMRGITLNCPEATDDDLIRLGDWLFTFDGYIKTSVLIDFLKSGPVDDGSKASRIDRRTEVESIANGGPLFPEQFAYDNPDSIEPTRELTGSEYTRWREVALAYASDEHTGMTPAQVNAAAREAAYRAIGWKTPPQLETRPLTIPRLRKA